MKAGLLLAGVLLIGLVFMNRKSSEPRGIRNNNPGNLIITGIDWVGKVPVADNTDGKFEQFVKPEFGIRALYRDVKGDIERKGLNTTRTLISAFAPKSENDTESYIQFVAGRIGIGPDDFIFPFLYPGLIAAIIEFENGQQPYSIAQIEQSFNIVA